MKSIFSAFYNALIRVQERRARQKLRSELLRLSDLALIDAGFDRALLESGVKAWPWRIQEEATTVTVKHATIKAANEDNTAKAA